MRRVWLSTLSASLLFLLTGLVWSESTDFGDQDRGFIVLSGLVLQPGMVENSAFPPGYAPLEGARVQLEGSEHATETDVNGQFKFTEAPEGQVDIVVSKEGYRTVRRSVEVVNGGTSPATVQITMHPEGARSSAGPLYVAYARRVGPDARDNDDGGLFNLMKAIAAGSDEFAPREVKAGDRNNPHWTPFFTQTDFVLERPSLSPSDSKMHSFVSPPLWPCFDASGDYLYVATAKQTIEILKASDGHERVANLPVQQNGLVTSLARSPDGQYLAATVMAPNLPGLMMIETSTRRPLAYLGIDDATHMIPTACVFTSDSARIYVTLCDALNRSAPGKVVLLDAYTGQTLASAEVGATPTDLELSPDGSALYVLNSGSGTVQRLSSDLGRVLSSTPVGAEPVKMALSGEGLLLVTNRRSNTVSLLDAQGRTAGKPIPVGEAPLDVAISPDGVRAFVSNSESGTLSVIDLKTKAVVFTTAAMPRANPIGLTFRPQKG